jgi:Secretion system C-terminal sorting domain
MKKYLSFACLFVLAMCCSSKVMATNSVPSFTSDTLYLTVCENSGATSINSLLSVADADAGQTETWSALIGASHGTSVLAYSMTSTGSTLTPVGLSYSPGTGYVGADTFVVVVSDGIDNDTTTVCVTVNPLPYAGIITGKSAVCKGSTITLSDAVAGGAWTSSKPATANVSSLGVVSGIASGKVVIKYTVTDACGTDVATDSISVDVPAAAIFDTSATKTLCPGSTLALIEMVPGGTWSSSSFFTAFVLGTTVAGLEVGGVIGITPGPVTITYTLNNGCGKTIATENLTVLTTAECNTLTLNNSTVTEHNMGLSVYPNPSFGTFNFDLSTSNTEDVRVVVTNMIGETVHSFSTKTNKVNEVVLDVPPGIYFITAASATNKYTGKVTVNR